MQIRNISFPEKPRSWSGNRSYRSSVRRVDGFTCQNGETTGLATTEPSSRPTTCTSFPASYYSTRYVVTLSWGRRLPAVDAKCDGATYWATGVKDRSITQAQGKPYNILPPLERRDLWDESVDGSPYTVVRAYPNFRSKCWGPRETCL